MTVQERYDVVIIGTGAGGGTLAYHLARAGKRILVLERGSFLPREKANWNTKAVFLDNRYHTRDVWTDSEGRDLHPGTGYWVGGNTKVYGAALFRLRKEDFGVLHHKGGISPAWPVSYEVFEPYYTKAERLYRVHGKQGLDPTEPPRSEEYPYPAISNEPRMQQIEDDLRKLGLRPFPCPLGLQRDEANLRGEPMHPLRHLRRLSLPGARKVRLRRQLHPRDHAPAERHAGHGRQGHAARQQRDRDRRRGRGGGDRRLGQDRPLLR